MSDEAFAAILARAFRRARAADANAEIGRARADEGRDGGVEHWSYEILMPDTGRMAYLVEKVLPKLVYFLDCRGSKLPAAHGVFASLFVGDELYLVRAKDLVDELVKASGLAPAEMVRRWGASSA